MQFFLPQEQENYKKPVIKLELAKQVLLLLPRGLLYRNISYTPSALSGRVAIKENATNYTLVTEIH